MNLRLETEGAGRPKGLYTFMLIRPMGTRSQRPQGASKIGSVTDESETNVSCSCEPFSEMKVFNIRTISPAPFIYLLNFAYIFVLLLAVTMDEQDG